MATNIFKLQAVTWEQSPLHTALYGNTRNAQEGAEMTVDWGDGTVQTYPNITPMHETAEGIYTVTLTYNDKITYYINGTVIYPTQALSLVEAVLDKSTVIEGNAFAGCWNLTKLTLGATTPPVLGEDAFASANNLTAIYVPYSAVNAYKTAAVWSTFADIIRGYFPMKEVTSGAHYTTVEVDTAEEVKFSFPSTSLSVEAAGGDITVALTDTAQAGDDETITVPDGESRMFIHHRMNIDTYYLTGSGTAKLYASNMGDVNPFKTVKRGGDGGGRTETVLWENDGTTNPQTITLSEAWSDFDELVIVTAYIDSGIIQKYENIRHTSIIEVGDSQVFWYNDNGTYGIYLVTSSTVFTKSDSNGGYYIQKIIGIKY